MSFHHRKKTDEFDEMLAAPGQVAMGEVVRRLPDEELSLSWRSELNQKLRAAADRSKRRRLISIWIGRPAFGLGLAGALVLAVWLKAPDTNPISPTGSQGLARAMINAHLDDTLASEVNGGGASSSHAATPDSVAPATWDPSELEGI